MGIQECVHACVCVHVDSEVIKSMNCLAAITPMDYSW